MRRKQNNKMNNNNNRRRFRGGDNNAGKIKSAAANRDKYLNMARDALASGDRVESENFLQHAEHYYRVLSFLQEEDARNRPERNAESDDAEDDNAPKQQGKPQQDKSRDQNRDNQAEEADGNKAEPMALAS